MQESKYKKYNTEYLTTMMKESENLLEDLQDIDEKLSNKSYISNSKFTSNKNNNTIKDK